MHSPPSAPLSHVSDIPDFMHFKPTKKIPRIPIEIQKEVLEKINILDKVPIKAFNKIGATLDQELQEMHINPDFTSDNSNIEVVVSIPNTDNLFTMKALNSRKDEVSKMLRDEFGNKHYFLNGKPVREKKINHLVSLQKKTNQQKRKAIKSVHHRHLAKLAQNNPDLFKNRSFQKALKEGKGFFSVTLKKNEIADFIKNNSKHITVVDLPKRVYYSSLNTVVQSTRINPDAFNANATGTGINIYKVDGWCPNSNYYELTTGIHHFANNYTNLDGTSPFEAHGTLVAAIIRKAAPGAHLYCHRELNSDESTSNYLNMLSTNTAYDIQNHSWNTVHNSYTNNAYSNVDAQFDNYIYANEGISIFVSAGNIDSRIFNPNNNVLSPAKAMNAITLGNHNNTNNMNATSLYNNPDTGAQKPEISAPGTDIDYGVFTPTSRPDNQDRHEIIDSGTSYASPLATALAADAMSIEPQLKTSSALLKAYMIASATKNITGGKNKTGEGGIKFQALNIDVLETYKASSPLNIFQDYGLQCKRELVVLKEGRSTRAVLSWLNRGSYVLAHKRVGLRLKLFVWSYDEEKWHYNQGSEYTTNSPYDIVKFTTPINSDAGNTSPYYVYMCNMATYDNQSKLEMGFAIQQE